MNKRQVKKKLNYEWQCEAICGRVMPYSDFRKTLRKENGYFIGNGNIVTLVTEQSLRLWENREPK